MTSVKHAGKRGGVFAFLDAEHSDVLVLRPPREHVVVSRRGKVSRGGHPDGRRRGPVVIRHGGKPRVGVEPKPAG